MNDMQGATDARRLQLLKRVQRYAWLLDQSVRVPVINYRVGLDGLLGLIPGVGDLAGGLMSGYVVWLAWQAGARGGLLARMIGNVLLETVIGAIPVLGDLFDFAFKANMRNARMLETFLQAP